MGARRFQQEFLDTVVLKAAQAAHTGSHPFTIVGNIYPGSGKTLTALQSGDALFKRGDIDTFVMLVPRRNLAGQVELSWEEKRHVFAPNALGAITHRENKWPLIRQDQSGYVSTYASLMANPALHQDQLKGRRVLLVLDEAQQLGADYIGTQSDSSTASADCIKWLVGAIDVRGIVVLSGTPFRADHKPLLFAEYETRADDKLYLKADVTASYSDGIEGEYLRLFDARLYDGQIDWQRASGLTERLTLSAYERGLRRFLVEATAYVEGLIDRFVEHLAARQAVDGRNRGLIACYNQTQATQVETYLQKRHARLRVLKAISDDGDEAQRNLTRFRAEPHDVLVTVQMAYIGYDQPFITVVLPLTGVREQGYLRQLLARSLRVVSGTPYDQQMAVWVLPGDPRMKAFIEQERQELEHGLARRDERLQADAALVELPAEQGWVTGARLTTQSIMGFYPEGDVTADDLPIWEKLVTELKIGLSPAYAKTLFVRYEQVRDAATPLSAAPPQKTAQERERDALDVLQGVVERVTHHSPFFRTHCQSADDRGRAQRAIRQHLKLVAGCSSDALTVAEIEQQIALVGSWLSENGVPAPVIALYRTLP